MHIMKLTIKSPFSSRLIDQYVHEKLLANPAIFNSGVQEIWSLRYLGNRLNDYAFLEAGFLKLLEAYEKQRKKELNHEE